MSNDEVTGGDYARQHVSWSKHYGKSAMAAGVGPVQLNYDYWPGKSEFSLRSQQPVMAPRDLLAGAKPTEAELADLEMILVAEAVAETRWRQLYEGGPLANVDPITLTINERRDVRTEGTRFGLAEGTPVTPDEAQVAAQRAARRPAGPTPSQPIRVSPPQAIEGGA
jgi:hypothetical protein